MNTPRLSTYADFAAYLESLGMFHMDMGLGRMRQVLAVMGLDQPGPVSVQVVGTNGKGSTSTFLAATLTAAKIRTGLYTSPHFLDVRERVRVDGVMLGPEIWLAAARTVLAACQTIGPHFALTYFELLTVLAALLFHRAGCAAAVFEAGLGGAHDATTALPHHLTVFTPVGLDHMHLLGPTPAAIAKDKAGALRPGAPALTGPQDPDVLAVLEDAARFQGVTLYKAQELAAHHGADWPASPALPGPHQRDNLRLALAAAWLLHARHGLSVGDRAMARAAQTAFLPGRMQWVSRNPGPPDCLLDGAHNQPGLAALAQALREAALEPRAMVFACLADKDVDAMLPLARSLCPGRIFVPELAVPGRASPAQALARRLGERAETLPDTACALSALDQEPGPVLVCGSLYLLAEAYALRPHWLQQPD